MRVAALLLAAFVAAASATRDAMPVDGSNVVTNRNQVAPGQIPTTSYSQHWVAAQLSSSAIIVPRAKVTCDNCIAIGNCPATCGQKPLDAATATAKKMSVIPEQRWQEASVAYTPSNSSSAGKGCGCYALAVCPCRSWALLEEAARVKLTVRVAPRSSTTLSKDSSAPTVRGSVTLKPAADQSTASCAVGGKACTPSPTAAAGGDLAPTTAPRPQLIPALIQGVQCSSCAGQCPAYCTKIAKPSPITTNSSARFTVTPEAQPRTAIFGEENCPCLRKAKCPCRPGILLQLRARARDPKQGETILHRHRKGANGTSSLKPARNQATATCAGTDKKCSKRSAATPKPTAAAPQGDLGQPVGDLPPPGTSTPAPTVSSYQPVKIEKRDCTKCGAPTCPQNCPVVFEYGALTSASRANFSVTPKHDFELAALHGPPPRIVPPAKHFSPDRKWDGSYGSWRVAGGTAQLQPAKSVTGPQIKATAGRVKSLLEVAAQPERGVTVMGPSGKPGKGGSVHLKANPTGSCDGANPSAPCQNRAKAAAPGPTKAPGGPYYVAAIQRQVCSTCIAGQKCPDACNTVVKMVTTQAQVNNMTVRPVYYKYPHLASLLETDGPTPIQAKSMLAEASGIRSKAYLEHIPHKAKHHLLQLGKRLAAAASLAKKELKAAAKAKSGGGKPKKYKKEQLEAVFNAEAAQQPKGDLLMQKRPPPGSKEWGIKPGSVTKKGRLHYATMAGEAPRTALTDAQVDDVARMTLSKAAYNKCSGKGEYSRLSVTCKDALRGRSRRRKRVKLSAKVATELKQRVAAQGKGGKKGKKGKKKGKSGKGRKGRKGGSKKGSKSKSKEQEASQ